MDRTTFTSNYILSNRNSKEDKAKSSLFPAENSCVSAEAQANPVHVRGVLFGSSAVPKEGEVHH